MIHEHTVSSSQLRFLTSVFLDRISHRCCLKGKLIFKSGVNVNAVFLFAFVANGTAPYCLWNNLKCEVMLDKFVIEC